MLFKKAILSSAITVIIIGAFTVIPHQNHRRTNLNFNQTRTKPTHLVFGSVYDTHPNQQLASSVLTNNVKKQLHAKSIEWNMSGAFIINKGYTDLNANVISKPYATNSLDSQNRPSVSNALLNHSTRQYLNRQKTGNAATIKPQGYHQLQIGGRYRFLYNRGHSLGYALIGNIKHFDASEANPKNITTQTAWANQASNGDYNNTGQNFYEGIVRKGLDQHKTIRYRVTVLYNNSNIIPSGSHIEAKSTDNKLHFNVFVPNVQPGVKINYQTGYAELNK